MLQIALAGLVLQGILSLDEAEFVMTKLSNQVAPKTVKGVLEEIDLLLEAYEKGEKLK